MRLSRALAAPRSGGAEALAKITREGRLSPQLPFSHSPCTTGSSVCLHLIYSCVQGYLGTRSAPRACLCVFITTQLCVDSPPYRSHLHHFTYPPGAPGLLPDLTSEAAAVIDCDGNLALPAKGTRPTSHGPGRPDLPGKALRRAEL